MPINLSNLFNSQSKNTLLGDFQDLQHLDGLSISAVNFSKPVFLKFTACRQKDLKRTGVAI